MTTDFNKNAVNVTGGIMPGTTDTPGDVRTRVETEADILNIPNPYLGMIVYVIDTGKRFEITKLKDKKAGFNTIKDALVDTYVEFDPAKDKGYAKEADVDAALEGKADKADLEGLASEEFVEGKVDEVVGAAPEEFNTLEEVAAELAKKVNAEDGKALMDIAEMERLAQVDNYDDQELRDAIAAIEIPDVSKFVEEEVIDQKIEEAKFDDTELKGRLDALEAIDHSDFLTEHQAIDHLAVKEEVNAALDLKADKSEIPSVDGLATEQFVQEKIDTIVFPTYDDTEVVSRLNALEAVDHDKFLTEHQDLSHLASKSDFNVMDVRVAALEAAKHAKPNFEFAVNMVADNEEAGFVVTGEFPNLVITLNLPQCAAVRDQHAGKMWIGWIPYDEAGEVGFNDAADIGAYLSMDTIQQGIDNGSVVEMDPQPLDKTSIGSVSAEAGFICAIVPEDSKYVAYLDNGMGGKLSFGNIDSEDGSSGFMLCQNGTRMVNKIDDVGYCLYGAYVFSPGERFIYIVEE